MAETHGGYRAPRNPAPVSGPGALSQRTDGGPSQPVRRLPNAGYGESAEFEAIQAGAPMAEQAPLPLDASRVIPMGAPSQYPGRPVTDGIGMASPDNVDQDDIVQRRAWLPALKLIASKPGTSNAFRQLVRQMEANL